MTNLVAILGTGQFGLVLADALAERGLAVRMWGPRAETVQTLRETRRLPQRVEGFVLPRQVHVTADDREALSGADLIVSAIPTQFVRPVWCRMVAALPPAQGRAAPLAVVSVSKGIENGTLLRPTEIIADVVRGAGPRGGAGLPCRLATLSGPTIAAELARRLPATMVAASADEALAARAQDCFRVPWLRVYRHDDPVGVELAGATKNVIALAAGMVDGIGAGDNAKSALLARGLAEIARLGAALGAKVDTFFGVAGVGDLATSCFSPSGRNRSCGERLARGDALEDVLAATSSVVEGVPTTRSVVELARARGVEMPITEAVHAILFEGLAVRDAIQGLMDRAPKAERVG
jgi:glycerol-3-phosphate dehydrogenase (NAD(P)+)